MLSKSQARFFKVANMIVVNRVLKYLLTRIQCNLLNLKNLVGVMKKIFWICLLDYIYYTLLLNISKCFVQLFT